MNLILKLFFPMIFLTVIVACTQASPSPTPMPRPDLGLVRQLWQKSPHANTYDQGKGPNPYCARCHSPRNWDPVAKIDPQPNCVSCKFSFDPVMRVAKSNPPVSKTDWKDIGCEVCHPMENGSVSAQIAWLNTATGKYESVSSVTVLCEKCHTDTETIRHKRDLGTSTHINFECTRCHDAHSTTTSCTSQACHPNVLNPTKPIAGHDQAHKTVSCVACHDAGKLAVNFDKSRNAWVTLRTTELLGRSTTAAYQSHNVQRAVDCSRCHAPNNPWGLKPVQGNGQ